jgi:alpha-glucosidase
MLDVMRFWLDRGADGFRIDVIWHIVKDEQFRSNPPNPQYRPGQPPHHQFLETYSADRPEVHDIIATMREALDAYSDRVMLGEIYLPVERLMTYYGAGGRGVHLPYNFRLLETPWDARLVRDAVDGYEAALPPHGWPNWVLGNHDRPRIASRVGAEQARVAAMLLLSLRGTPTIYYGDEIGMHDVPVPPDRVRDPLERNVPGLGLGRDPQRTPMQWDGGPNAGFTGANPWLPIADDYTENNVAQQFRQPGSMLTIYRELIALRRREPSFAVADYASLPASGDLFAFLRRGDKTWLIALNLGPEPARWEAPEARRGKIVLSTHLDRTGDQMCGRLDLRPNEGIIVELGSRT